LVPGQPLVIFGFVGIKIIKDHVYFLASVLFNHFVHKGQEFLPSSSVKLFGFDQSSCYLQSSEQGGCAMSFVLVIKSCDCFPIRKFKPALSSFKSLYGGFLINADNHCLFRRIKIQAYNIRGLLRELRIGTYTPTMPSL